LERLSIEGRKKMRKNEISHARMQKARRIGRVIAAFGFSAALIICGCSGGGGEGGDEAEQMVAQVTVTRVTRADIEQTATLSGNVVALPNQDVKLSSLVAGRITALDVAEGDRVHDGELLATIESHTYEDQLRQADAALAQAQATLQNAQENLKRNQTLYQRGIVAGKDLQDAQLQVTVAEATEHQDAAADETAKAQLNRTRIASPLNGVVAKRFVSVGEQVDGSGAQPIIEVANIREVDLAGSLPAPYLGKIHVGEAIPVSSDSFPGKAFAGRVIAISPTVDPATNVGSIRIRIANPGGDLKLGMYLTAQVPVEKHANALTVPPQSIYHDETGATQVYVVQGDTAKAAPVKIGIQASDRVEILSGVKAGDTVILTGGYGLGDTTKVKIQS
jgi:RND family efflux transporter MFP subunit